MLSNCSSVLHSHCTEVASLLGAALGSVSMDALERCICPDPKIPWPSKTSMVKQGKHLPRNGVVLVWQLGVMWDMFLFSELLLTIKYKKRRTPIILRAQNDGSRAQSKLWHISWACTEHPSVSKTDSEHTGHRIYWDITNQVPRCYLYVILFQRGAQALKCKTTPTPPSRRKHYDAVRLLEGINQQVLVGLGWFIVPAQNVAWDDSKNVYHLIVSV